MLIVRVELHSAVTGKVTEIARMMIANDDSGTEATGHYTGETYRGTDATALNRKSVNLTGRVVNFSRRNKHVWNLVGRMLHSMGYGGSE